MSITIRPKRVGNDSTTKRNTPQRITTHHNVSQFTAIHRNASQRVAQPKRIGNDSTKTERGRAACVSQARRVQTTKKGDTEIRKPPNAYLSISHVGPNPILFIGGRGVA